MEAFKLNQQALEEGFSGGSIMCSPAGHMLDIKATLDSNGGVIVTDDTTVIPLLRAYSALESTDVPENAKPVILPGAESLTGSDSIAAPPFTPQLPPQTVDLTASGEVPAVHVEESQDEPAPPNPTATGSSRPLAGVAPGGDSPGGASGPSSDPSRPGK